MTFRPSVVGIIMVACLCAPAARAIPVVQFLVYVDENTMSAFYLGSQEGAPKGTCKNNPYGTQSQCTLTFAKDSTGIPTVTFGGKSGAINKGDLLLTEANSSVPSDVIRFTGTTLQFYSDPGDPNDTSSLPTTDPAHTVVACNDSTTNCQEIDLSLLTIALANDSTNPLNWKGFLNGKIGALYIAKKDAIGGTGQAPNNVGYIFVSDGEPTVLPEPTMIVPLGILGLSLLLTRRIKK